MFKGIFSIFFILPILLLALSCSSYPLFKSVENYTCGVSLKIYDQSKGITHFYEYCQELQLIRKEDKYIYNFKVAIPVKKIELLKLINIKLEINYKNKPDETYYPDLGAIFPSRVKYAEIFIEDKKFNLTWDNSWITQGDDNRFFIGRDINIKIEKETISANDPAFILKPGSIFGYHPEYQKIQQKKYEDYGK